MKKIIVSGCCNCPYLTLWNNGEGNGIDSITTGDCSHPSFNKQLFPPKFNCTVVLYYDTEGKAKNTNADKTPEWCPLPEL